MISVVIPAFREAPRISATVAAVRTAAAGLEEPVEIIVVDDGSDDDTAAQACAADQVICLEQNRGKGGALTRGLAAAQGELIVMLDADLCETAAEFPRLVAPVRDGAADMTIAVFSVVSRQSLVVSKDFPEGTPAGTHDLRLTTNDFPRGGFGLALRTARWGVARLTGRVLTAPLSGQRALRAGFLPLLLPLEPGFGLEVGMDIDALRAGLRVQEVPTTMQHAATGRNWAGFRHRGRQLAHILRALARRAVSKVKA
jgi:glycosyltransferase involved in cell wall biosynthesis